MIKKRISKVSGKKKRGPGFKCFNCGQEISGDIDRCPKCGWTWETENLEDLSR